MTTAAPELYLSLMKIMRSRLDIVSTLETAQGDAFSRAETAAFHGRKVVEGIAFACMVATEHGLNHIPRDAKGKWNAEDILRSLLKKNLNVFPSPSAIRFSTPDEQAEHKTKGTIEGIPERRLTHDQLIQIYQGLHGWLHELNPYVSAGRDAFHSAHSVKLWSDLRALNSLVEQHFISIRGEAFFCVLRDRIDGETKVASMSGIQS